MSYPSDLKYSKEHEWVRVHDDGTAEIGVTHHAQSELGDIVYVDLESEIGETVDKDEVFGTVEAVKTTSDLYMPIGGEILEFNEALEDKPELVNESPYGDGWMIKIKISDASELEELMSSDEYQELIG